MQACPTFIAANRLIHVAKRHHQIAVAGHVEGGHGHFGAGKRRQQFPITVDVAVPVEGSLSLSCDQNPSQCSSSLR
jgi:hypothetical protein